jgi:hypothetical protein
MAYVMKTSMSEEEQRVSTQQWGLWMQKLRRSISKRKPSLQDTGQSSHSEEHVEWRSDDLSSLQAKLRILRCSLWDEDSSRLMSPQHVPKTHFRNALPQTSFLQSDASLTFMKRNHI